MSPKIKIKVGTRDSRLALAQVEEVFSLLKAQKISLPFGIIKFKSKGDKDRTIPLSDPRIPDDFFTDTLDEALLKKQIDIAIHSAKDLPQKIREGLNIFALTKSLDETDAFVGKKKLADLTKGAKVGTSSLLRKQSVKEINPKVAVVDVRGNIEERLSLLDKGKFAGLIVATCALKRLKLDHRIIEVLPWEATALQGQLAVVGREDDKNLQAMFASIDVRHQYGQVTLVGAGPGDPELITMKAINALKKADCVFYDYLVHKDLLDYAPLAEKIDVGKRKGEHTLPQEILSRMMRQKAMEEKRVVRLKGGDPLIFGRGADEIKYLQAYHIRVDVIPGISSATGIPSILGIPLTARGISSSVAFLSGHEESERHKDPQPVSIPKVDTIVFLMGLTKLNVIVRSLLKAGWEKNSPMIVISKGTRIDEKIVSGTIATIESLVEAEKLEPPALMIVGEIVKFWDGQKRQESILYLGTDPEKYKILGQIIHFPMIEISPVTVDSRAATKLLKELEQYHLIILTSRFAVKYFFEWLAKERLPLQKLTAIDFACIGEETAEQLRIYDFNPKIIADLETSVGLLEKLEDQYDLKGKKILFPRSSLPNPFLIGELKKRGAAVTELTIYQNTPPPKRDLPKKNIDKIVFTSPSTVKNFLANYGKIPEHWTILSKGPRTSQALKEAGYESKVIVI